MSAAALREAIAGAWGDEEGNSIPRPVFPGDYDSAVSQGGTVDVIYIHDSYTGIRPLGIGYDCVERESNYQIHIFGPSAERGIKIREELERVLLSLRKRTTFTDLLFIDRISTRATERRTYSYVYDIRTRKEEEI